MTDLIQASEEAAIQAARESVRAWIDSAEFVSKGSFLHFKSAPSFEETMQQSMISAEVAPQAAAAFSQGTWQVWSRWSSLYRVRRPAPGVFIPLILGSQRGLFTANSLTAKIRRALGEQAGRAAARKVISRYAQWFFASHMDWLLTTVVSGEDAGGPLDGSGWGLERC